MPDGDITTTATTTKADIEEIMIQLAKNHEEWIKMKKYAKIYAA